MNAADETRHTPQGVSPQGGPQNNPATRSPRSPAAPRSAGSTGRRPASLLEISARLQPRDLVIAHLLDEHTTLTTAQLAAALFGTVGTCRDRLEVLRTLGFVDRFHRPGLPGSTFWVPGLHAARYIALHHDQRPPSTAALHNTQDTVLARPDLAHLTGATQFGIDLIAAARTRPDQARLERWWSDRTITAALRANPHTQRPDGHGIWRDGPHTIAWLLEYDTGTEPLTRLLAKVDAYARLREDRDLRWPILFSMPTRRREQNLHQKLAALGGPIGVTVATLARDSLNGHGITGPVWRTAGNGRTRLRLTEIPCRIGRIGPFHPGPATPDQDPLLLLRTQP